MENPDAFVKQPTHLLTARGRLGIIGDGIEEADGVDAGYRKILHQLNVELERGYKMLTSSESRANITSNCDPL